MIATASPLLRVITLLLAVLALNSPAAADPLKLSAETVHLDETDLNRKSVGKLNWRGGLVLKSGNADFKELSALVVSGDGLWLTSVTDEGYWVTMGLVYDQAGHLSNVKDGKIGRLLGLKGKHLELRSDRDAESLARSPDGSLVVAFELNHRLWRYTPGIGATAAKHPEPPEFTNLTRGSNDGVEALVTLANGALLVFVEDSNDVTESPAYLQHDGGWKELSYQHDQGFRPTGATRLPDADGDVLVIERCFELCDGKNIIRLRRLEANSIVPGADLEGEVIAELKDPFIVDNFEGVAARRAASGETLVYLLSDDNGNKPPVQRTLLLMFALME